MPVVGLHGCVRCQNPHPHLTPQGKPLQRWNISALHSQPEPQQAGGGLRARVTHPEPKGKARTRQGTGVSKGSRAFFQSPQGKTAVTPCTGHGHEAQRAGPQHLSSFFLLQSSTDEPPWSQGQRKAGSSCCLPMSG